MLQRKYQTLQITLKLITDHLGNIKVLTFKRAHYSFEKNPETNTHFIKITFFNKTIYLSIRMSIFSMSNRNLKLLKTDAYQTLTNTRFHILLCILLAIQPWNLTQNCIHCTKKWFKYRHKHAYTLPELLLCTWTLHPTFTQLQTQQH